MGKRKRRSKSSSESGPSSCKKSKKHDKSKTTTTIKKKRKNWSVDLDKRFKIMTGAVEDVIEKKMTIRKAAEKWGVKRSTLADRVSGRVELGRRSGPPTVLTRAEEQMLAEWVISMAQRGFGFNKHKLLRTVKKILDKDKRTTILKKRKNMPGNKWYRQFVKRNPRVKLVTDNAKLMSQPERVAQLEKLAAATDAECGALNCMLSGYASESGSESDTEFDSELDSESESELGIESPSHQSPSPVKLEMMVAAGLVAVEDFPKPPQVDPEPLPAPEPMMEELETVDRRPESPAEDFDVDPNSDPAMSVGITVTITTSDE